MDEGTILIATNIILTMPQGRSSFAVIYPRVSKLRKITVEKSEVIFALKALIDAGFVEYYDIAGGNYELTTKGLECQRFHRKDCFRNYLTEKAAKAAKEAEKDEVDMKHKSLQIADLEFRLKTIEDMQERQKRFWSKQNISILIAIGAFLATILNFLKDILLP